MFTGMYPLTFTCSGLRLSWLFQGKCNSCEIAVVFALIHGVFIKYFYLTIIQAEILKCTCGLFSSLHLLAEVGLFLQSTD